MGNPLAIITGTGSGLSASLAELLSKNGYDLRLAARNVEKLSELAAETGAETMICDVTNADQVSSLFDNLNAPLRVAVAHPSARVRGPVAELDPEEVRRAIDITAFGSFLVGQAAARVMLDQEPDEHGIRGTILFTGASAGEKGFPQSATFAMGKFAQRGLAQAMARELHPKGIHVAWVNIDGGIRNQSRPERVEDPNNPDSMLSPDAIAETYLALINQPRSAWTNEIAVRPWVEKF